MIRGARRHRQIAFLLGKPLQSGSMIANVMNAFTTPVQRSRCIVPCLEWSSRRGSTRRILSCSEASGKTNSQ